MDRIISDKFRDVPLRKGIEMTLEKTISICRTEDVDERNQQWKEVDGISRNQNRKKARKGKG